MAKITNSPAMQHPSTETATQLATTFRDFNGSRRFGKLMLWRFLIVERIVEIQVV